MERYSESNNFGSLVGVLQARNGPVGLAESWRSPGFPKLAGKSWPQGAMLGTHWTMYTCIDLEKNMHIFVHMLKYDSLWFYIFMIIYVSLFETLIDIFQLNQHVGYMNGSSEYSIFLSGHCLSENLKTPSKETHTSLASEPRTLPTYDSLKQTFSQSRA